MVSALGMGLQTALGSARFGRIYITEWPQSRLHRHLWWLSTRARLARVSGRLSFNRLEGLIEVRVSECISELRHPFVIADPFPCLTTPHLADTSAQISAQRRG